MDDELDSLNLREMMTMPQINVPKRDVSRYNGGYTGFDFGAMTMPLPYPDEGKKWAVRWHDTPSGELLTDVVQVPVDEPVSDWYDGYPKYDK